MDKKSYTDIEARHGIVLPSEFKALLGTGRLDTSPGNPKHLWLFEAEWLPLESVLWPEFWHPPTEVLVPFAVTGARDFWCWWKASASERGVPVAFCPADSAEGEVYAPSFAGFLFRRVLDYASGGYDDLAEARNRIEGWAADFGPLIPGAWIDLMRDVAGRTETSAQVGRILNRYLIAPDAIADVLAREWRYPELDARFTWR